MRGSKDCDPRGAFNMVNDDTRFMLEASFEDLERRCAFLQQLYAHGHRDEALHLCCCYIEALGSFRYPGECRRSFNFVTILKAYGGDEELWHIHLRQLIRQLLQRDGRVHRIGEKLTSLLASAPDSLYTEEQVLGFVGSALDGKDLASLKKNLWLGTLANVAYTNLRSVLVHGISGPDGVTFPGTLFRGTPLRDLDFERFHPLLLRIVAALKQLSIDTRTFCGNDILPKAARKDAIVPQTCGNPIIL